MNVTLLSPVGSPTKFSDFVSKENFGDTIQPAMRRLNLENEELRDTIRDLKAELEKKTIENKELRESLRVSLQSSLEMETEANILRALIAGKRYQEFKREENTWIDDMIEAEVDRPYDGPQDASVIEYDSDEAETESEESCQ